MSKHTTDIVYRVWDDASGERIEVGPDGDALGLIGIRWVSDDGKAEPQVVMTREWAKAVHEALGKYLASLEAE